MSTSAKSWASPAERPLDEPYRALSTLAVVSLLVSPFSLLALVDWSLAIVPAVGIACGMWALARIRRQAGELTGERLALVGVLVSGLLWCAGWTRLAYAYAHEVPPGYQRIHYDMLQPDPSQPGQVVPPAALDLEGRRVFIKGYTFPGPQSKGVRQFMLLRDNRDCCFGGNPKISDMIEVTLDEPLTMDYSTRMRSVGGVFHVEPTQGIDGLPHVIYHLAADYLE